MRSSPVSAILNSLLVQHHAALRTLSGEASKLAGWAQHEKLALCLEGYFDGATDELRVCERLISQRRLKVDAAADKVIPCLLSEAAAAQELEAPGEILDVLLARAFLRIQHCQIGGLGVLQTLSEEHGDREILALSRDALEREIDAEETLSALIETDLADHAVGSNT